jgi:FkbM family methyltransferase
MSKIVTIENKKYIVNEDEFCRVEHKEYNNLRILDKVGELERIISLICEIKCIHEDIKGLLIEKSDYGGFVPINCASSFEKVSIMDYTENAKKNVENHKINNIFSFSLDNNVCNLLYLNDKDTSLSENIDLESKNQIIITKSNSITGYANKYLLSNSDIIIYVSSFYSAFFYAYFSSRGYIGSPMDENAYILTYDNLINLCIMVKNAGPQFEKMLIDNLPIIDRWTILDTGSTDETINIINKVLVGKKNGNLYQETFINFRDSRNRLLDLADTSCKYNIMLDDTYVVKGDLRAFLNEVRGDQYANSFTLYIQSDDTQYGSNRITKSNSGLRYIHTIHEVITDKNNINVVIPENKAIIDDRRFDYMEKRTQERKQLDLKLLYEEVEENPQDPRAYYYLAQTYNLLEDYENAYKYFLKRAEFTNSGFIQERVDAVFEAARVANFKLNKPWHECMSLYEKCYKVDESRPEALYFIGIHYYLEGSYKTAFPYLKKAFEIGYPTHCQYSLKPTLSFHFLPKFLTRICYNLEEYKLGEEAALFFLRNNNSSAEDYAEIVSWYNIFVKLNMYSGEKKITNANMYNKPLFVFVADGGFNQWTGSTILEKGVGGSETYIIEMARYIQKTEKFQTIVFCNTPGGAEEIFENTIYKPLSSYYEFINTTYVDTCIISRFSEYLPVTFKGFSENVYLVVHDLTPSGVVIPMDIKLKNVFCLTEWHVSHLSAIFPQLANIMVPFYYGIDDRFKKEVVGGKAPTKNKFIYSSFPNRGLLQLLKMWSKIIENVPTSTLHIYSDVNNKWSNDVEPQKMQQIRELLAAMSDTKYGIHYHGWVSKKELAEAWLTADIWFYPCTFAETFCLTALEAASSKTFVVTNDLAALQNTVGNRGCIIKGDPTTEEWQEEALDKLFYYLVSDINGENDVKKQKLIDENFAWAATLTWESQAQKMLDKYILPNKTNNNVKMIETICSFKLDCENDYHILKIGAFKGNVPNDTLFTTINANSKVIFVEPVPSYYYELKDNYNQKFPNNKFIYLNNAVSDKEEKIQIYYPSKTNDYTKLPWWIDQLASSNKKHCEDHGYTLDLDMININAITVKQIVDYCNIKTLFCLMIDTEGSDFKILMSIDFKQFKPLYIVFENMHLTSYHNRGENYNILLDYLSQFGYKIIGENESDTIVILF